MIYQSQEELDKALAYWKHLLRLDNWEIAARIVRASESQEADCGGSVSMTKTLPSAVIHLLNPTDYPNDVPAPQDHEQVLVHELVHCIMCQWNYKHGSYEHILHEQAVNSLAHSFVKLKRKQEEK